MDFKIYGFLVGEIRGESRLSEGFKILHRIPILILPESEGLDKGIHTNHNKRSPPFRSFSHLGHIYFLPIFFLFLPNTTFKKV